MSLGHILKPAKRANHGHLSWAWVSFLLSVSFLLGVLIFCFSYPFSSLTARS